MMRFPEEFISKVSEAHNLVEVISEHTPLKRTGQGYMGLCPFPDHKEKTASFSVSEEKQVYHCFGCNKSGNIYTFVQQFKGLSFVEAVEYLADKASLDIPQDSHSSQRASAFSKDKKAFWKVHEEAVSFYRTQLRKAPTKVSRYLKERNLSLKTVDAFSLGWAPDSWHQLTDFFRAQKISMDSVQKTGLIKEGKKGFFDIFRNRLIFPIQSHRGEFVGFGARLIDGKEGPKYLNSPESPIFSKGKILYGLHKASPFIRSQDQVLVVEGYMDFLTLYQAGFENVVANLGTALTSDHVRLLKRYTKNVCLLFDGDEAGQKAVQRSLPILLREGLFPKGVFFSEGLDPDSFLQKKGPSAFRKKLQQAPHVFRWFMDKTFQNYKGEAIEKVQIMDSLSPLFKAISDERLLKLYLEEISDRLSQDISWVKAAMGSFSSQALPSIKASSSTSSKEPGLSLISLEGVSRAELYLFNLALMKEAYFQDKGVSEVLKASSHQGLRTLFKKSQELYRQAGQSFDRLGSLLTHQVASPERLSLFLQPSWQGLSGAEEKKFMEDCLKKAKSTQLKAQGRELSQSLKNSLDSGKKEKLERFMNIHRQRVSLLKKEGT